MEKVDVRIGKIWYDAHTRIAKRIASFDANISQTQADYNASLIEDEEFARAREEEDAYLDYIASLATVD